MGYIGISPNGKYIVGTMMKNGSLDLGVGYFHTKSHKPTCCKHHNLPIVTVFSTFFACVRPSDNASPWNTATAAAAQNSGLSIQVCPSLGIVELYEAYCGGHVPYVLHNLKDFLGPETEKSSDRNRPGRCGLTAPSFGPRNVPRTGGLFKAMEDSRRFGNLKSFPGWGDYHVESSSGWAQWGFAPPEQELDSS